MQGRAGAGATEGERARTGPDSGLRIASRDGDSSPGRELDAQWAELPRRPQCCNFELERKDACFLPLRCQFSLQRSFYFNSSVVNTQRSMGFSVRDRAQQPSLTLCMSS